MRAALEDILYQRWPNLYRGRLLPSTLSSMYMGFAHGDGWFALIDAISDVITIHDRECGLSEFTEAEQVKQKVGGLRFYVRQPTEFTQAAIWFAADMSLRICERTGNPGKVFEASRLVQTLHPSEAPRDAEVRRNHSVLLGASLPGEPQNYLARNHRPVADDCMVDVPAGWLDIVDCLLALLSRNSWRNGEDAALPLRLTCQQNDGRLIVNIQNPSDGQRGAIACASALSFRTDLVSGAIGPVNNQGVGPRGTLPRPQAF